MAFIKRIYRLIIPRRIRSLELINRLKTVCNSYLFRHEWIYDKDYYELSVDQQAVSSSAMISESIIRDFSPDSVIDVGCGTGALLLALMAKGCKVVGLENSETALAYCKSRNIHVKKFDIEKDELLSDSIYDVAISLEVAEHLPERKADRYVDLLSHLSNVIVFSAAPPGQLGTDHINLQPNEYWIAKFISCGFVYDRIMTNEWKKEWQGSKSVEGWYYMNLMIFRRL
jgi:2-polyprenyl-3-methyl-5-hydroxy-6-metoxy-1,4-benzoquinol methylase